jgi:hypothetical protein
MCGVLAAVFLALWALTSVGAPAHVVAAVGALGIVMTAIASVVEGDQE